jgi:riboflavin kinase/FMN adenylyltransferase
MTGAVVNYGLGSLPRDGVRRAITIGKFDGVHRGHAQVLKQLLLSADGAEPTVITFDRHPHTLVKPDDVPLPVISESQKVELLERAGIRRVIILPFDQELSSLSHEEFSTTVLAEGLSAQVVLVGADFRYGNGGAGTVESLAREGEASGFRVDVVADVCEAGGTRVSSTMIRDLLEKGAVAEVAELLQRRHALRGQVGRGFQRGRALGYPTANLSAGFEGYLPADGVYATTVVHNGISYPAATSIGVNPTFGDLHDRTVESHLIDQSLELYGETIVVEFVEFIRGMQKFPSPESLSEQMSKDEERIRLILNLKARP